MRTPRLIVVLILFQIGPCIELAAEVVRPDIQYQGEAKLEFPDYGASMVLPTGWVAVLPSDRNVLLMRSQDFEAHVFATIEEMTLQGARSAMSQTIAVGNGVVFRPKGQVQIDDSVLTAEYSVSGSRNLLVGQVTTVVGESGRGVSFMAASGPQDAEKLRAALGKIITSLSLVQPKRESSGSQAKGNGSWMERLSGRKLSRFFTRSGYTEEEYIWLCPEGLFFRSSKSGGFGGGASGAFQAENAGEWTISGGPDEGILLLTYNDGSTTRYRLAHEGTKLFLDGKRYFRETIDCK